MLYKNTNCKPSKKFVHSMIYKTLPQQYHCTSLIKRHRQICNCTQSCYTLYPHTRYHASYQPHVQSQPRHHFKLPSLITPQPSSTNGSTLQQQEIHVKGVKGRHYSDDSCHVCNKQLDANNPHNLMAHLNGAKHIKNVLNEYSNNYQQYCIYCNAACHTAELRHVHISSLQHSSFINSLIDEIKLHHPDHTPCILSIAQCQSRGTPDPKNPSDFHGSTSSKSPSKVLITTSAAKIRKAISECYENHDSESIQEQLGLLQKLHIKCTSQLTEKDHISILYVLSSLMRSNDLNLITDGIIKICKLFSEDLETLQPSKWKMNHKLFEQMVDIMILSVNLQQRIVEFLALSEQHNELYALKSCLGIEEERKFLQPFSMFFAFFKDINKWQESCFESDDAHKYFMKWTQLIFQDMMYNLRDIRLCKQPNFDATYQQLLKPYLAIHGLQHIDLNDPLQRRKWFAFQESKRTPNSGPFTNVVLCTALDCTISQFAKGSFVLMYPEEMDTNHIDCKRVMIGYLYKLAPTAQTISVQIANHSENVPTDCRWHLLSLSGSSASFEAQFEALQKICGGAVGPQLTSILYNNKNHDKSETEETTQHKLYETELVSQLNDSQRVAVEHALNNDITLIQGPPGTGKTHVAAAIVEQFLKHSMQTKPSSHRPKILLSAYSNIAVDVLTERVLQQHLYPLRLGTESTLPAESQALLNTYPAQEWASRIAWADIICATSIGSANPMLKNVKFDLVLIDETTQSTESGLLVALSKLKENGKVVLIGDHKQLPPTVLSKHANDNGLGVSLFERLIEEHGMKPLFLATQYRMHPKLAEFPSLYFYDGQLLSGITENDRQIPNGFDWPRADFPIAFIQTDEDAKEEYAAVSAVNRREADIVGDIVTRLILENEQHNVTVIAPYAAQKQLIHNNLYTMLSYDERKRVKVRTVDGFQGSECDIIVFTATRSNEENVIGFLQDHRRVNVMLTRTKSGLIVVGDRDTLSNGDKLWRSWLKYVCDDNNAIVYDYKTA